MDAVILTQTSVKVSRIWVNSEAEFNQTYRKKTKQLNSFLLFDHWNTNKKLLDLITKYKNDYIMKWQFMIYLPSVDVWHCLWSWF